MYRMLSALSNDIGGKNCMLMLNNTVNNAWFARE